MIDVPLYGMFAPLYGMFHPSQSTESTDVDEKKGNCSLRYSTQLVVWTVLGALSFTWMELVCSRGGERLQVLHQDTGKGCKPFVLLVQLIVLVLRPPNPCHGLLLQRYQNFSEAIARSEDYLGNNQRNDVLAKENGAQSNSNEFDYDFSIQVNL